MEWRNQVAVVTGGARGISRATARLLAQRSATVRILRDREQPGRFGALLGSLTTTRPIVPQNYSPARIRFIPAARINPIFCYQCYLRDRYGRLAFRC
jgi:NAD(P)-dependent dehydrogenase (short-subunit alcohol dehydrogenase family)